MQQLWMMGELILVGTMIPGDLRNRLLEGRRIRALLLFCILEGVLFRGPEAMSGDLLAFLPGMGMLLGSLLSREKLGAGDGCVFFCLGAAMDPGRIWRVCFQTLVLSGLWAALLLGWGSESEVEEGVPLIPCLGMALAGELGMSLLGAVIAGR